MDAGDTFAPSAAAGVAAGVAGLEFSVVAGLDAAWERAAVAAVVVVVVAAVVAVAVAVVAVDVVVVAGPNSATQ